MSLFCENGEYLDDRSYGWERYVDIVISNALTLVCSRILAIAGLFNHVCV